MADYSGHVDPWTITFRPAAPQYTYWWTHKDFSGSKIEVPSGYLGLLIDVIKKEVSDSLRSNRPVTVHRIKWDSKRRLYWYPIAYSPCEEWTKAWLARNGYEVRECPHVITESVPENNANVTALCLDCNTLIRNTEGV